MDDFSQCMVSNSRMAARAITRRYDAYARPFGITSTQFSLLGAIIAAGDRTVTELAEERGFERTTLIRNLDRLEKLGLISSGAAEHGNGRICRLTPKGEETVQRAAAVLAQGAGGNPGRTRGRQVRRNRCGAEAPRRDLT